MLNDESSNPKVSFMLPSDEIQDIFEQDYDLLQLRTHITEEFLQLFRDGVNVYLAGDWELAREVLVKANELMNELAPSLEGDGPSKTLLKYMANHDWKAPNSWKGFRPLTSK